MVKHIILWNLKKEFTEQQKKEHAAQIKQGLENLINTIEGIVEIKVITEGLESSTADIMLDSTFVDEQALKFYKDHPDHVHCANTFVRPFVCERMCMDYEV